MFMDPRHSLNILTYLTYQAREGNFFYAYSWSSGHPIFFPWSFFSNQAILETGVQSTFGVILLCAKTFIIMSPTEKLNQFWNIMQAAMKQELFLCGPLANKAVLRSKNKFREEKGKRCLNTDHFCRFFILSRSLRCKEKSVKQRTFFHLFNEFLWFSNLIKSLLNLLLMTLEFCQSPSHPWNDNQFYRHPTK